MEVRGYKSDDVISWVDILISINPQGVMAVLSRNGYSGFLAPQDFEELRDAAIDFVEQGGEEAVIELFKSHPLYDSLVTAARSQGRNFHNADGGPVQFLFSGINFNQLIRSILMVIGAAYLFDRVLKIFGNE